MSITSLAPELTDTIVDQLCDDHPSLKAMALTCRRFLPASRFHLFRDVEMKQHHFTTRPFPKHLAHLAKQLRLTGNSEHSSSPAWGSFLMGCVPIPAPSLTSAQLREGLLPFQAQSLDLHGIKSSSNCSIFAAVVTTPGVVDNVRTLSLGNCCVDTADPLALACSLPRLHHLRFSALAFDNSRSMIRQIESTSAARYWAYSPTTGSDWASISEGAFRDTALDLREIDVYDTEWSENLRLMMVSLFNRLPDALETFTLRVHVNYSDLDGEQDAVIRGLSPFQSLLKECGHKIRRLDLRLGRSLMRASELSDRVDLSTCPEIKLGFIFEFCPNLDVLRLSGSLCGKVVQHEFGSLKPNVRIIHVGETGEQLDRRDVNVIDLDASKVKDDAIFAPKVDGK